MTPRRFPYYLPSAQDVAKRCARGGRLSILLLFSLLSAWQIPVWAQKKDSSSYLNATSDVRELLDLVDLKDKDEKTTVATQIELPIRETPSTVTVITEEDIARSGARDLRELLMTVPGIDFETDVQNVTGMGMRGLWGHEGKVLVIWDGHTMNETSYGTFSFMQHIFLGNIKRIEIIRGPGSAVYGGLGGLGVINIISKNFAETNSGGRLSQSFGVSQGQLSRQTMQLGLGKRWSNGFSLNTTSTMSRSSISNRRVYDTVNYADSSAINTSQIGVQAGYKNLNLSVLYDGHKVDDVDGVGRSVFTGWYAQLNYQFRLTEKFSITPIFRAKIQQPWNLENVPSDAGSISNVNNQRYVAGLRTLYAPNEIFSLVTGAEFTHDVSAYKNKGFVFTNGRDEIRFENTALFAQSIYKTPWAIVTAGARVDMHNYFGSAFVPRVGLTKAGKHWHAKLLYSNAFKAPTIINLNVNKNIRPERLSSSELEVGYQKNEMINFTGNLFYTRISRPILYYSPDGLIDNYQNGQSTGSAGFEVSTTLRQAWGRISANYSYYHAVRNRVPDYAVEGHSNVLLGFPSHKIVTTAFVSLSEFISASLTSVVQGKKFYTNTAAQLATKPAVAQINVILTHTRLIYPGLTLSAGIYNVLNQTQWMVQPYHDIKSNVPGMGREYGISINYQIRQ